MPSTLSPHSTLSSTLSSGDSVSADSASTSSLSKKLQSFGGAATKTLENAADEVQFGTNRAHRFVAAFVTGTAQVAAQIPALGLNPATGIPSTVARVAGLSGFPLFRAGIGDPTPWRLEKDQSEAPSRRRQALAFGLALLPRLMRVAGNLPYGAAMETAGVGVHALASASLLRMGVEPGHIAYNAAWMLSEGARAGAMFAVKEVERKHVEREIKTLRERAQARVAAESQACNSLGAACELPVSQICVPGTHLSDSAKPSSFVSGSTHPLRNYLFRNQRQSLEEQLEMGNRLFTFEFFHNGNDEVISSHNKWIQYGQLNESMATLGDFLHANPKEVLFIKISDQESYVPMMDEFGIGLDYDSFAAKSLYAPSIAPFATKLNQVSPSSLGELIEKDQRAVFFSDLIVQSSFDAVYLRDVGTPGNVQVNPGDLWQPLNRLSNFFTTFPISQVSLETNRYMPMFFAQEASQGHAPNFVAVNDASSSRAVELCLDQNLQRLKQVEEMVGHPDQDLLS